MTADHSPAPNRLQRLWLCETLSLREEHAGPLEDGEANRHARATGNDLRQRIEARALWLAARDGQVQAQRHWLQGARLALWLLLILALASGAGLAVAALGDGSRAVNVFWALGSLLGLHLALLIGWALSLMLPGDQGAALGRLWLWLSERLARDARAAQLAPALVILLQRRRLNRWLLGMLVHGLWLVALSAALLMLLALLSTRRYGFVWETTLLGSDTFVALTQALGALPGLLGFALPDAQTIRASGDSALTSEAARHAWAGWLIGVLLVYGLLPRLLLGLFCLWRWQHGQALLQLDLSLPSYRLLAERLQPPSERLGVLDPAPDLVTPAANATATLSSSGALLVAIELDPQRAWPPALPKGIGDAGILDSREQRQHLLEQLGRFPPARLLIACDPRRSADRGTLALLGELARSAGEARIWLLQPPPGEAQDSQRLGDWHQALDKLGLRWSDCAPQTWLESGHD
ncbi:DUF2868 domain-containing protein [Pseudomonas sp. PDM14]|uniref:DUF2868 domain-containing protein n=1 Tax=Pseudomonas sp. PDM14 TaxID=2769288 RepID=UPI0017866C59|nr:DUF2868 domain-containing protein [Pseudomonas sp. PDM14]MBD9483542.1 DUF2868 domain-containing protein [Pseudomonas sp. PDM14]